MAGRERLARHLFPTVLNVDPGAVPVLRVSHAEPVSWSIADGVLAIAHGTTKATIPLDGSIAALRDALLARGFTISSVDHIAAPSAALLEGRGGAGDALSIFSSPLWTMLDVYGVEVDAAEANVNAALEQLFLDTASDELLDIWGASFGVVRAAAETDAGYRQRIVDEVFRPRNNRYAIEKAIHDLTGLTVTLNEPFREIFQLSRSALSGNDHLQDGRFFTWNVFQPIYHSLITEEQRQEVLAIIERNRPAGCVIVGEGKQPPIGYASGNFLATPPITDIVALYDLGVADYSVGALSNNQRLSNQSQRFGSNVVLAYFGLIERSFTNAGTLGIGQPAMWTGNWDDRYWFSGTGLFAKIQTPA